MPENLMAKFLDTYRYGQPHWIVSWRNCGVFFQERKSVSSEE